MRLIMTVLSVISIFSTSAAWACGGEATALDAFIESELSSDALALVIETSGEDMQLKEVINAKNGFLRPDKSELGVRSKCMANHMHAFYYSKTSSLVCVVVYESAGYGKLKYYGDQRLAECAEVAGK